MSKMPTYNIKHTFDQPVAMQVTSAQLKFLIPQLKEMGYSVYGAEADGFFYTKCSDLHFVASSLSYMPVDRYLVPDFNYRLFLAIAAMTTGEKFIPGEYGVAKGDIGGDKIKAGAMYRIADAHSEGIEIPGVGWAYADGFRKATLTEIEEYFKLK